jgi:CubicO group peptidase (beta-lactamase class C family)
VTSTRTFAQISIARLLAAGLAVLFAGLLLPAQPALAAQPPSAAQPPAVTADLPTADLTTSDADAWLDGELPALLAREEIPGAAVSIVRDGKVLTQRGYGLADTGITGGQPRAVDPQRTVFRVGSVSKTVVATAVMQLVQHGQVDLDHPVTDYVDIGLPTRFGTPITLRHLLTHTAGFEDVYANMFLPAGTAVPPLRETVTAAPPEQIYEPGTSPAYSNYSYALAAYVVESITGRDAAEYLQAEVLQAAGMTTASFAQPLPEHLNAELAQAYPTGHREPIPFELVGPWPPGSLTASAADMGAFMLAQLDADGSALLDQPTLALMHSPALGAEQLGGLAAGPRMALGFFEEDRNGRRILGHSGDLIHSHAALQLYPDDAAGIFIALNGSGARTDSATVLRHAVLDGFADRYFPPTGPGPSAVGTAADHAQAVAGSYGLSRTAQSTFMRAYSMLASVQVSADAGTLTIPLLTDAGGTPVRLAEVEPWVWQDSEGRHRVAVRVGESGAVEAIGVSPAFVLLRKPAWQVMATPVVAGSLGVLLFALLAWPVRAIIGWRLKAPLDLPHRDAWLRRIALAAAAVIAVGVALWAAVVMQMAGGFSAWPGLVRGAQAATALGGLGLVPAAWRAGLAWTQPHKSRAVLATLVALAFLGFGAVAVAGGLLLPDISY